MGDTYPSLFTTGVVPPGALPHDILFLLYEVAGVVTNLIGGWIGARLGLKVTLFVGLKM